VVKHFLPEILDVKREKFVASLHDKIAQLEAELAKKS
jgi:uncharacterized small protein (DUF1192 family)